MEAPVTTPSDALLHMSLCGTVTELYRRERSQSELSFPYQWFPDVLGWVAPQCHGTSEEMMA